MLNVVNRSVLKHVTLTAAITTSIRLLIPLLRWVAYPLFAAMIIMTLTILWNERRPAPPS